MNSFKSFVYPSVVLLSVAAAALPARAESPMVEEQSAIVFAQPKTRDQVQVELFQARADGSIKAWSMSYNHMTAARSLLSRDEVRREAVAANQAGSDTWFGEDSGSFEMARLQPMWVADRIVATR